MISPTSEITFVACLSSPEQRVGARLLIDSLHSFGGAYSSCPVWVFEVDAQTVSCDDLGSTGVQIFPLNIPDNLRGYWFADKVCACAQAEELLKGKECSLTWLNSDLLILQPPELFNLSPDFDAAVRPVHIRNVGLPANASRDHFWGGILDAIGVKDIQLTVESFVDRQRLRAYFNTHAISVNPARGIFRRWLECFEALVGDGDFQNNACPDELHKIFLHQAVLSALIASSLKVECIRHLPPEYNYPYNLHGQVPVERKARQLNDLVSIAYENRPLDPQVMEDIQIEEPLRSWLVERAQAFAK